MEVYNEKERNIDPCVKYYIYRTKVNYTLSIIHEGRSKNTNTNKASPADQIQACYLSFVRGTGNRNNAG